MIADTIPNSHSHSSVNTAKIQNSQRQPSNSYETKMKLKDLAQELDVSVRDLQKDCSKLNIEVSKTNLLEDSDVQKIREYRQAANDAIERRETESGTIVRRRKTNPKTESTAELKTGTTIEQDKIKKNK